MSNACKTRCRSGFRWEPSPGSWSPPALGGWALALMPAYTWGLYAILDLLTGLNEDNADPATPEQDLFWYRLITLIWFPIQITLLVGLIWYAPRSTLSTPEQIGLFCGMGIMSGS